LGFFGQNFINVPEEELNIVEGGFGMSKLIDLTGQRFGRLIVLNKDNERITKSGSYWIC
jgi:hypothetical protein